MYLRRILTFPFVVKPLKSFKIGCRKMGVGYDCGEQSLWRTISLAFSQIVAFLLKRIFLSISTESNNRIKNLLPALILLDIKSGNQVAEKLVEEEETAGRMLRFRKRVKGN